jgi:hypothetical protein
VIVRVITPGMDDEATVRAVIKALLDPDCTSVIVHKPGAYLNHDGREVMVTAAGEFVPAVHTGVRSDEPEPAGIC